MIDNIDPKAQYPKELGGFQMGRPMKWAHLYLFAPAAPFSSDASGESGHFGGTLRCLPE